MKRIDPQQVLDDIRGMVSERAAGRLSIYDLELCDEQGRPMLFRGAVHGIAVYETVDAEPVLVVGVPLGRTADGRTTARDAAPKLEAAWAPIAKAFPAVAADFRVRALMTRRARELAEEFRTRYPKDREKPGEHVARYPARSGIHKGGWAGALFDASAIYARMIELSALRELWAGAKRPATPDIKLGDADPDRFVPLDPPDDDDIAGDDAEVAEAHDPMAEAARRAGRTPAGGKGKKQKAAAGAA